MPTRREFLEYCTGGVLALVAPGLLKGCAAGIPILRGRFDGIRVVIPRTALTAVTQTVFRVQAANLPISLILRRLPDGEYLALSTVCTHSGCEVRPLPSSFQCPCHGSEYDLEGRVTVGPAREPLQRYAVKTTEESIMIKVTP